MQKAWFIFKQLLPKFLMLLGIVQLSSCTVWWYQAFTDEPKQEDYTKEKAAGQAMEKLVKYADRQHVPVYEFRGPYFEESLGLDFPTYIVCYKHPIHFFCYDDWTNLADAAPYVKGEEATPTMKWLQSQPE